MGLQLGLTKSLLHQPSFLSLTLTGNETASILLEKRLFSNFNVGADNVLLSSADHDLIPITLDLRMLSFEATGIVCSVAAQLVGGHNVTKPVELLYLSTAKAVNLIVYERDLREAMQALGLGQGSRDER